MQKAGIAVLILIAALIGLGAFKYAPQDSSSLNENSTSTPSLTLPEFSLPSLEITSLADSVVRAEAWQSFQKYLGYAQSHDLDGLRTVSYQISEACNDPEQEEECTRLMDSAYLIGSEFKLEDFKNVETDGRQIILHTDGSDVTILFFIREDNGAPKLLGIQFCRELPGAEPCVETNREQMDRDKNGWWDSVESLFYKNRS